jgi:long-chain fatty acid transport protein
MGRTTSKGMKWSLALGLGALPFALAPGDAAASGFAAARFGGEHGHPTTDNATAIYYNPAGIALSKGTHVFVDATTALRWASYDRPGDAVNNQMSLDAAPGANDGKSTLFNGIMAPFIGATSDFGTDFIYGGLGLYFPFGGSAVWDKNPAYSNNDRIPGAVDGTQRWYSVDGTIRSMYVTGALGFNIRKIGLTLGVSGSVIRSEVVTLRARNTDGTDDVLDANGNLKEGRSYIDANGWQGGFALGATYNLLKKDILWLGASYTSQPNVVGGMTLQGDLSNTLALAEPSVTPVELTQTLPEILRFGARYRPIPKVELRLFGDFTRWSVFDKQCVLDKSEPDRSCEFDGEDTALDDPESFGADGPTDGVLGVVQHLPRYWKNGGGVRAGVSYWVLPQLEVFVGAGYDSSAVPVQTLDPALMDMNKVSTSAGARWQIIKNLAISLTSTELFFFTVDTKGKNALNQFQSPTRQPDANGEYKQFFQLLNFYADVSF